MPRATYMLELELSYNTWTDVTADWQISEPLRIERGIVPGERIAQTGRMIFALHNPDGRYTPDHASVRAGFESGIGVRLRASDGAATSTLFYGRLANIETDQVTGSRLTSAQPHTRLVVEDDIAATHRVRMDAFPLLLDATPGDIASRLIDEAFTPPGLFDYWRLGHPQASLLGTSTTLPGSDTGRDVDSGQSVFPWVADTWPVGMTIHAALSDVCASEGGTFHLAADGTPVFGDRHRRPKHVAADAALNGTLAGVRIQRGESHVANAVEVTVHPRTVGTSGEVLWESGTTIRVPPDAPRTVIARYRDPDQQVAWIGALETLAPESGVDYKARQNPDGSGLVLTKYVDVRVEAGATAALLTISTRYMAMGRPTYITTLRLRGTPLRAFLPVTILRADEASDLAHGHQPLSLDMPLQDDAVVAADMASALLANRKDPHSWIEVGVEATVSADRLAQALSVDVGDRLEVTDAALALNGAACFVDGIRHEIVRGGASHRAAWLTSPADLEAAWLLGQSGSGELGSASRLGY